WLPMCTLIISLEVVVLAVWALVALARSWRKSSEDKADAKLAAKRREPPPGTGHLVLVNASPCGPKGQSSRSDSFESSDFDSGICYGKWFMAHKPTDDPVAMESGSYPFAEHLHSRKRLWEFRLQLTFREHVPGDIFFGCEQDRYYHVGTIEHYISGSVIGLVRSAAGDGMYQSHGDDPSRVRGETERPAIMFPLWVMDQLIITPEGQKPPSLQDPNFATRGIIRASDRKSYKQAIDDLDFRPGPTFTFGFWCIAQFVDGIGWKVPGRGLLPEVKLNEIGTHPPFYLAMYSLRPKAEWSDVQGSHDRRHLDSRKIYIWRSACWSSKMPPTEERAQDLLAKSASSEKKRKPSQDEQSLLRHRNSCCCGA
ncbi:unnamed protein product, partial [Polarella glacialis]